MAGTKAPKLPTWMIMWFVIGGLVQLWDAIYILFRPHTMPPNGKWSLIWWPYIIYMDIDLNYKDVDDCFTRAMSMLNFVEIAMMFYLVIMNSNRHRLTELVAFTSHLLTMWKTALYMVMYTPISKGTHLLGTDDPLKLLFLFVIPNSIWVVLPALGAAQMFGRISKRLMIKESQKKKK